MVYVREAHPTDGWKMESNTHSGIAVKQPVTFPDRVAVACQFCERLKATIPVVVDEINDPVGNAYSAMPARLYVIDKAGKVAYKSGRGAFGFRTGEMEQALVMALLEQQPKTPPTKVGRTAAGNSELPPSAAEKTSAPLKRYAPCGCLKELSQAGRGSPQNESEPGQSPLFAERRLR